MVRAGLVRARLDLCESLALAAVWLGLGGSSTKTKSRDREIARTSTPGNSQPTRLLEMLQDEADSWVVEEQ
eukprot:scaffold912_cov121-Skeletonema_dohrnii-CCMP3373.AAC.3